MSLLSVFTSLTAECSSCEAEALAWVIQNTNLAKFSRGVEVADISTKMVVNWVLAEYNYTSQSEINRGIPDKTDRVHGTDVILHAVLKKSEFRKLISKMLIGDDSARGTVFIRQKYEYSTEPGVIKEKVVSRWQIVAALETEHARQLRLSYADNSTNEES